MRVATDVPEHRKSRERTVTYCLEDQEWIDL